MAVNIVKGSSVKEGVFNFHNWTVTVRRSHILQSKCNTEPPCAASGNSQPCSFCRFSNELRLHQLPEMTFADNVLKLEHKDGFGIEFNCFDALHMVDYQNDLMKVAVSDAWMQAREKTAHIKDVVKPFDWTYTTDYKGTLLSGMKELKVTETDERIDLEKLKVKEKILFYDDLHLYEDELADNGVAQCSVKIRIMPDSFFILLRFFLRVDNILIRMNDTRVYHEVDKNYVLREYMSKESKIMGEQFPLALLTNPSELWDVLDIKNFCFEKLELPL